MQLFQSENNMPIKINKLSTKAKYLSYACHPLIRHSNGIRAAIKQIILLRHQFILINLMDEKYTLRTTTFVVSFNRLPQFVVLLRCASCVHNTWFHLKIFENNSLPFRRCVVSALHRIIYVNVSWASFIVFFQIQSVRFSFVNRHRHLLQGKSQREAGTSKTHECTICMYTAYTRNTDTHLFINRDGVSDLQLRLTIFLKSHCFISRWLF